MNTKLAIVGIATALFVGAGLSMAVAAEPRTDTTAPPTAAAMAAEHAAVGTAEMDRMHAAMSDEMPAELREECDEMHAAMGPAGMGGAATRAGAMHDRHHVGQSS